MPRLCGIIYIDNGRVLLLERDTVLGGYKMEEEYWKIYRDQFAVSNFGKVIKLSTMREVKPRLNYNGYVYVDFRTPTWRENKRYHRLMAELFIPNPKGYDQVNHIDGDKTNNSLDNLEWCNQEQNMAHNRKYGPKYAKLTDKQIEQLKKDYQVMPMPELCKKYNIRYTAVLKLVRS